MTNLRVRPIDPAAPGSFRERSQAVRVLAAFRADEVDLVEGLVLLENVLFPRLETTDGSDLDDALDKLSADDFDGLIKDLLKSEVPTESAEN